MRDKYAVRQLGFQEIPIVDIVAPITKKAIRISSVEEVPGALSELIKLSLSDRPGPVWLDIPLDIQAAEISVSPLDNLTISKPLNQAESIFIDQIVESWNSSTRPLLLLGNGVRISKSVESVRDLLRKTNTPAILTWKALDFLDEDDPLNAGRPGAIAQRWSNFAQQSSDFILVLGARLDLGQTAYRPDNFAPNAKIFIVDIDQTELKKLEITGASLVHSDVDSVVLELLSREESDLIKTKDESWLNRIANWKKKYPLLLEKHKNPETGVNLYEFIDELSAQMTAEDILIPGSSGACSEIAMQAFKVKIGQRVLNSEGLGPMGFGIAAPIGGCLASNGKRTISIDGDGGFLMNVQELGTLKFLNLPIKIFVLNNDGYGSIKASQDRFFQGRRLGTDRTTGLGLPNLEEMVKGFQIDFLKVSKPEDLKSVIADALLTSGPCVVEIKVDPNQITEPRTYTEIDSRGQFITSPMEKLSPTISEEELDKELSF
jgi:acetolactate synthase-1/2/3 large subunit